MEGVFPPCVLCFLSFNPLAHWSLLQALHYTLFHSKCIPQHCHLGPVLEAPLAVKAGSPKDLVTLHLPPVKVVLLPGPQDLKLPVPLSKDHFCFEICAILLLHCHLFCWSGQHRRLWGLISIQHHSFCVASAIMGVTNPSP